MINKLSRIVDTTPPHVIVHEGVKDARKPKNINIQPKKQLNP
jgi:hypothetical protein